MRRREFITLLGGAAAVWPLSAKAQQVAMPMIGFLGSDSPQFYVERLRALRDGLKETGYVEGQNLAIEYRWAQGRNDRLPELAGDLVRRRPAAIVASTTPSALALKAATATIPIVIFIAGDPVALGLVGSLNRPSGNFTGTTTLTLEVGTKWLQLLHDGPGSNRFRHHAQSYQSGSCEGSSERPAGRRKHAWAAGSLAACRQRPRLRCGLCMGEGAAGRWAHHQLGFLFLHPR